VTGSLNEPRGLRVLFGPKAADTDGRLARLLPGRLVIESRIRHRVYTTLHLRLEVDGRPVLARGVVERVVPLGPWPDHRGSASEGPVALTVLLITECPELDELAARLEARQERRRHPRHDVPLRVTLGGSSTLGSTRALNVSRGGLYLEAPLRLDVGAALSFRLHLPGDVPALRIDGRVVHVREGSALDPAGAAHGAGIAVDDLVPQDAAHLDAFLASLRNPED